MDTKTNKIIKTERFNDFGHIYSMEVVGDELLLGCERGLHVAKVSADLSISLQQHYCIEKTVRAFCAVNGLVFACSGKKRKIKVINRNMQQVTKKIRQRISKSFNGIQREATLLPNILFIQSDKGILMLDTEKQETLLLLE